ncbi:tryptophan--tRNA ligase [bacterium]|mgnify:CR=1 FL=1|nr:tryptophan--tRNA ligase [bacterium]|tara:strand:- start:1438 stop:2460 length:1023 start_codon:yes stop_codon:yes gene_type:complete
MDKDNVQTILTGDRPTGKLHLGHLVGSLKNRVELQDSHKQFVMIADVQALTDNADNPEKVRSSVFEVAVDNLAAGLNPQKSTLFIQSEITALPELFTYFLNLVTLARLKRNPTVKNEMKEKGFDEDVPAGFLAYPVSQAADILAFKPTLVPVGEDQLPMIEQTNEIVEKFNRLYPSEPPVFNKVKAMVPEHGARLPGIDGKGKASKSLGNAILLSDSNEEIEEKVMKMYTDPEHINVDQPGKVEGNVVFTYLDIFDPNKDQVAQLKEQYQKGGLGDVELKKRLTKVLQDVIEPIREKREYLSKNPDEVMKILEKGTEEAQKVAQKTLEEAKAAMKINYFT